MNKKIDFKNNIVNLYDADTNLMENEIISYLDRHMKVRFFSAHFDNNRYVFIGNSKDLFPNSITISSYRLKKSGEKTSVEILK